MTALASAIASWQKRPIAWVFLVVLISMPASAQNDDFEAFPDGVTDPIPLRSQIPGDFFSPATVPIPGSPNPLKDRTANRLQHDFDIYSWETFIALSWPAQKDGSPKPEEGKDADGYFSYPYGTVWENWMQAEAVFRENAVKPVEWGNQPPPEELYGEDSLKDDRLKPVGTGSADVANTQDIETTKQASEKRIRSISWMGANLTGSTHGETTKTLSAIEQAVGTGRLSDRRGFFVRYEVMLNRPIFDYIVQHQLYEQSAQGEYAKAHSIVFPFGTFVEDPATSRPALDPSLNNRRPITKEIGSIVIKAAWKVLSKEEVESRRFYTIKGVTQFAGSDKQLELADFGLVALHIIHKSADVAQWTWSTFEHDDNCPDINTVKNNQSQQFSFFDRTVFERVGYAAKDGYPKINELADLVDLPKPIAEPVPEKYRSRLIRIIPTTRDVAAINRQFKARLATSVWKNYQLVSTQWPLEPAGVFLGKGEIEKLGEKPGTRKRRDYGLLEADIEKYNSGDFLLDERRLAGPAESLRDRPSADKQLGYPAPRALANSIIETSQQGLVSLTPDGSPSFRSGVEHGTSSCMHCHGDAKSFGRGDPSDMSFLLSRARKSNEEKK